jgi:hypothetical protein
MYYLGNILLIKNLLIILNPFNNTLFLSSQYLENFILLVPIFMDTNNTTTTSSQQLRNKKSNYSSSSNNNDDQNKIKKNIKNTDVQTQNVDKTTTGKEDEWFFSSWTTTQKVAAVATVVVVVAVTVTVLCYGGLIDFNWFLNSISESKSPLDINSIVNNDQPVVNNVDNSGSSTTSTWKEDLAELDSDGGLSDSEFEFDSALLDFAQSFDINDKK